MMKRKKIKVIDNNLLIYMIRQRRLGKILKICGKNLCEGLIY